MDVIALVEAGFESAVAPLGTAVTEDQLRLLWRLHPEPVVALDGDTAGLRAGLRVADLALPLITAGQGLRFALLPSGQDPDDLIKASGAAAMRSLIARAQPMATLIWERETAGQTFDSPERKAALAKKLRDICARIADPELREQYNRAFNDLKFALFRSTAGSPLSNRRKAALSPLPDTRGSLLAAGADGIDEDLRVATILTTLAAQPSLVEEYVDALIAIEIRREDLAAVQDTLLALGTGGTSPDMVAERLADQLAPFMALPYLNTLPVKRARENPDEARRLLNHELRLLSANQGGLQETLEAMEQIAHLADEGLTWRLGQARAELERARRVEFTDPLADTPGDGADGHSLLDRMISQQVWVKKRRPGPT
jgi:DNA primase